MLVVIAEKEELKLVEELGYGDEPIIITGVGGLNVIRALKDFPKDMEILNIGYAGSNVLPVGTRVYIDQVHTYHEVANFKEPNLFANGIYKIGYKCHDCYTSTDFVIKTDIDKPCVFDMELAFIRALFDNVRAIKVVSDNLNKEEYKKEIKKND